MNDIAVLDKGNGWKEAVVGGSKLVCHVGGRFVGRDELALAPLPEGTKSWRPVPHVVFADGLKRALANRGHVVRREAYALSKDGLKMFGLFDLAGDEGGMSAACGFRASNDRSVAFKAYAGANIFACDNEALSGQAIILSRKHTSRLDLDLEVGRGVVKWEAEMNRFRGTIKKMQDVPLTETETKTLIYRAMIEDEIMPGRLARRIHDAYFGLLKDEEEGLNDTFQAWGGNTAWRLNNAFTWAAKEIPPMARSRALVRVGEFFEGAVGAN
jgi:hypothetical protein